MINQVTLLGKVIKEVDVKHLTNGVMRTSITVVTSESFKKNNETQYKDSFHRITFYGDGWKWLSERLKKDVQVYIEGKLDYSSYEKNGQKVYTTDIIGSRVQVIT